MQRLFLLLIASLLYAGSAIAQVTNYTVDTGHSTLQFKVRHLGISSVTGTFKVYEASLQLDPRNLNTLNATAKIDAKSINTGIDRRDEHLRSADFFDVEKYPDITFVSTGVRNIDGNEFELLGNLTMHGVTRPVVLDAEYNGTVAGQGGKQRVGFSAETTINRMDYGLRWNNLTEAGGIVVGDKVEIELEISAVQQ